MQVDIGTFEQTVLVPVRFSDSEDVPNRFEGWDVLRFLGRVRYYQ